MKAVVVYFKKINQDILFNLFAALAMGIGVHQGVKGFKLIMAGDVVGAWAIMVLVGGGLFALDMKLKKEKETHNRSLQIFRIMSAYTILALINMAGNFNAFFTGSLQDRIVKEELNLMQRDLNGLSNQTITVLETKNDTSALIRNVENELLNLQDELKDPNNTGFGPNAESIIEKITGYLGIDHIKTPILVNKDEIEAFSFNLTKQIKQRLNMVLAERRKNGINREIQNITAQTQTCLAQITAALSTLNNEEDDKKALIGAIAHFNATLGVLKRHVPDAPFTEASDPLSELGKIYYTLEKASSGKYPGAVWFALILSLIIDFIVPFVFLVVIGSKDEDYKQKHAELSRKIAEQDTVIKNQARSIKELRGRVEAALR